MHQFSFKILGLLVFITCMYAQTADAQSVSISDSEVEPDAHAILDINSTDKGLLIPRMTTLEKDDMGGHLTNAQRGLMVFDMDKMHFYFWDGSAFVKMDMTNKLIDEDGDTEVNVEAFPDDDAIRFKLGGTTKWVMDKSTLSPMASGGSTFIGWNAGWLDDGSNKGNVAIGRWALGNSVDRVNNVAIGDSALYANGTGGATGFEATYNTAVGKASLKMNNTGSANTALGALSMNLNSSGSNNVALGSFALGSNTTGSNNVANGVVALFANTSGEGNVASGHLAMTNNETGSNNVALGRQSLLRNTHGDGNIAIGRYAMRNNETGSSSIAIGQRTMYSATNVSRTIAIGDSVLYRVGQDSSSLHDSQNNIGIGSKVMYKTTEGANNNAVGVEAMYNNTTGTGNVAFGSKVLWRNTTGYNNVAIGRSAMFDNQTGVYNVSIGYSALNHSNGSSNVAVGSQALSDNEDGDHNTAVGNSAMFESTNGNYNTAIGSSAMSDSYLGSLNVCVGYSADVGTCVNSMALGASTFVGDTNKIRIGSNGIVSIGGAVGWSNFSDGRFKKNIEENVKGLEFIEQLRPVTYNFDVRGMDAHMEREFGVMDTVEWEGKYERETVRYTGFIAQEVQQAASTVGYDFSGVDVPDEETEYYALRYSEFVVPLVKAVQEQQVMIEELQAELESLRSELRAGEASEE